MDAFFEDIEQDKSLEDNNSSPSASASEAAKVKPSGSGLTFFLNEEDEEDEDDIDEAEEIQKALNDPEASEAIISQALNKGHEGQEEDLQKELTEKYFSGKMSFSEYIKRIDLADESESEAEEEAKELIEESSSEDEWMPAGEKRYQTFKVI